MSKAKEARAQEILNAACKVFSTCGFEKAKIEDIAKLAGIGKSTIYEYFNSKMDIFVTLFESIFKAYRKKLVSIAENDMLLREKLLLYMHLHCSSISERFQMIFIHMHETTYYKEMQDFARSQYAFVTDLLVSSFNDSIKRGEIRADIDIDCACCLIYGTVQKISLDYLFGLSSAITDEEIERLVDGILQVLSPLKTAK